MSDIVKQWVYGYECYENAITDFITDPNWWGESFNECAIALPKSCKSCGSRSCLENRSVCPKWTPNEQLREAQADIDRSDKQQELNKLPILTRLRGKSSTKRIKIVKLSREAGGEQQCGPHRWYLTTKKRRCYHVQYMYGSLTVEKGCLYGNGGFKIPIPFNREDYPFDYRGITTELMMEITSEVFNFGLKESDYEW